MFESRDDALDFRDRVVTTLIDLGRRHDLLWHISPELEGVELRLPLEGHSQGVVRGRLAKDGFELRERSIDSGDWVAVEVRPG